MLPAMTVRVGQMHLMFNNILDLLGKYILTITILSFCQIVFSLDDTVYAGDEHCASIRSGNILYVDPDAHGQNNGSSWADAFTEIQSALGAAASSAGTDQLWIRKGKYAVQDKGLRLPPGVQLFGGFSGGEKYFDQRNPKKNLTLLNGLSTARHIMVANSAGRVVIDGLVIVGGEATGNLDMDSADENNEVRGAGILSIDTELAVCNSAFENNSAKKFGGAIYQQGGLLRIYKSIFSENHVLRGLNEVHDTDFEADTDGDAVAVQDAQLLSVVDSYFENNVVGDDGGAIATRKTDVEIINSQFLHNMGIATALPAITGLVG